MRTVGIIPPIVADGDLVFDETETRQILRFFWPHLSSSIASFAMTDDARRFAQEILIVAIDASYAMGFVHGLFNTVARPTAGLKAMGKKLARRYIKHWWKHTTAKHLEDVRIYESVRGQVALNFRTHAEELIRDGRVAKTGPLLFAHTRSSSFVWS